MNKNQQIFSTPEGYFTDLQSRLQNIPAGNKQTVRISLWTKVSPYVALAACFVMAFFLGNLFIGGGGKAQSDITLDDFYYADIIPVTDPYSVYDDSAIYEVDNQDDVLEYLISSGTSVDYIAYLLNQ